MKTPLSLIVALLSLVSPIGAAIPAPEKLLSDDTLVVVTVPDWAKFSTIYSNSLQHQFWNDPAM